MAKSKSNAAVAETENTAPVATSKVSTPDGFEDVSSDIEAVYDYKTTLEVYVKPLHFTLSDSTKLGKPQILIHAELLKPAVLVDMQTDSDDVVTREFPVGTRIGVWYRPGLRQLMQCANVTTYVAFEGERDVGQIQPMKMFKVSRKKGSTASQLTCAGDFRKSTRNMALPWEDKNGPAPTTARTGTQPAANDDDDVPF